MTYQSIPINGGFDLLKNRIRVTHLSDCDQETADKIANTLNSRAEDAKRIEELKDEVKRLNANWLHRKINLRGDLKEAEDEVNKDYASYQAVIDELRAKLAAVEAAAAEMRALLQRIWDEDSMGWIVEPNGEMTCGSCNSSASKDKHAIVHEDYCFAGPIFKALQSTPGTGWKSPAEVGAKDRRIHELEEQLRPGSPTERAPTQWAYDQACEALNKHKAEADKLREGIVCLQTLIENTTKERDEAVAALNGPILIRCVSHRNVPAFNGNEASGSECAACEVFRLKQELETMTQWAKDLEDLVKDRTKDVHRSEETVSRLRAEIERKDAALESSLVEHREVLGILKFRQKHEGEKLSAWISETIAEINSCETALTPDDKGEKSETRTEVMPVTIGPKEIHPLNSPANVLFGGGANSLWIDKPTEPGWYWWRRVGMMDQIVSVTLGRKASSVWVDGELVTEGLLQGPLKPVEDVPSNSHQISPQSKPAQAEVGTSESANKQYRALIPGVDVYKEGDEALCGGSWFPVADSAFCELVEDWHLPSRRPLPEAPEGWTVNTCKDSIIRQGDGEWVLPDKAEILDKQLLEWRSVIAGNISVPEETYRLPWPPAD